MTSPTPNPPQAYENSPPPPARKTPAVKRIGLFLGLTFFESNPRKQLKRSALPLGNLPLELLTHLSSVLKTLYDNDTFKVSVYQTHSLNAIQSLNDVLAGTDRILNTPLPIAYSIAISQITWVYILLLPFQLYKLLGWITIPASVFAAYIILGIALIGREIENPFGDDVNDLPLDTFCKQIRHDVELIMSKPRPESGVSERDAAFFERAEMGGSVEEIREALAGRVRARGRRSEDGIHTMGDDV